MEANPEWLCKTVVRGAGGLGIIGLSSYITADTTAAKLRIERLKSLLISHQQAFCVAHSYLNAIIGSTFVARRAGR